MWPTTPSVDTLTRPRVAVAAVSVVAAVSLGYYAWQTRNDGGLPRETPSSAPRLHRSSAVRRSRPRTATEDRSSSPSDTPGDENVDSTNTNLRVPADAETVVDIDNVDDWWNGTSDFQPAQRAGHNIVNLLFRVSEDNARRNGCVHRGCQCNSCGMVPIRGVRYRCANCADFDLCETCEAQGVHIKTHVFYKIKVPAPPFGPRQMQPVWYTGDPDNCRRSLPRGILSRLSKDTGFERPELEAFWEQWTYMANTEWRDDPDELCVAMDRKTFERCLVPTGGSRHAAPNLIHDRMFSFYDSNHDDIIGFSEFLHGLSYRKRKDKLRKVFEGYDIDGDGYVNRRDFLRMFRAYYVLYKQMHKDILDGLEDQLLASTEAQQLVSSRQPLSSLFGREGRIPPGDSSSRFEGKTHRRNGSVEVADGYTGAFTDNRGDTATREDILASLFAYDTESGPRRLMARNDTDTNWRTVRRVSGGDLDRAYWSALLDPPSTLEEIPNIFNTNEAASEDEEGDGDGEGDSDGGEDEEDDEGDDAEAPQIEGSGRTYSESRVRAAARSRKLAPKLEKQRRDMARKHLHDRWKRRQFYLDEEEGGRAPDDWENDEDILANINRMTEESKSSDPSPLTTRSRSSSKVRFAEDADDLDIRSNPSTSSRSVPERWGGMDVPDAERDAGKEILYQVTQQAFNELLDTIFKKAEDLAITAAETAADREKYRTQIDTIELPDNAAADSKESKEPGGNPAGRKAVSEKSLDDLLAETGYAVVPDEPRNAVELDGPVEIVHEGHSDDGDDADSHIIYEQGEEVGEGAEAAERRDPTLPQFRPNTVAEASARSTGKTHPPPRTSPCTTQSPTAAEPADATLRYWKQLTVAEAQAKERGGWGRLSFAEFEEIYKRQEDVGNRLDYLGSWIDFCIP
ncbi:hypothetical protein C2857_007839 [Epichloe festucae Fl1]|uniref:EF hand domain protein n=1 Tax=Epichloe festucae (strain Fl1) TaxID=877507 RepID=A0A7S9KMU1_EPIFF|nr:hypothetical protein C2857_007839 [Epichloe festucae Fl1]